MEKEQHFVWKEDRGLIRGFCLTDLDRVMEIWLQSNCKAHAFIPKRYWLDNYEAVKQQLPKAEVYLYEEDEQIWGFAGMTGDYLAGIFVEETRRSMGIGKRLLSFLKTRHPQMTLHVYEKNERAVCFYEREGFVRLQTRKEEENQETEFVMAWGQGGFEAGANIPRMSMK